MKFLIRRTAVVIVGSLLGSPAFADPIPEWVNSYSADGSCYCAPNIDTSLSKKITPTPVGGKSIHQICERIGDGPGLAFENDEFNHPVYTDAQCGNGPAARSAAAAEDCEGRLTDDDIICMGVGPAWDLKTAFSRKKNIEPKSDDNTQTAVVKTTPVAPTVITPKVTVVDTPVIAPDTSADAVPAATVVAEKVIQESTPVTEPAATVGTPADESLPLATVVESQPLATVVESQPLATVVESQPLATVVESQPASEKAVVIKTDDAVTETPLLQPENAALSTEKLQAVQTSDVAEEVQQQPQVKRIEVETSAEASAVAKAAPSADTPELAVDKPVVAEQSANASEATEIVADNTNSESQSPAINSGIRINSLIEGPGVRFKYIQVSPIGFDFGGNGGSLEASVGKREGWGLVGRAAVVEEYSEFMLGASYSYAPNALNGATMTMTLGGESGSFDLGITDYADSGVIAAAMLGYDFNSRIQAQGGVSYSTFFDGDPSLIGLLLIHLTPALDIAARVEMGDNDNASVGLRFHY